MERNFESNFKYIDHSSNKFNQNYFTPNKKNLEFLKFQKNNINIFSEIDDNFEINYNNLKVFLYNINFNQESKKEIIFYSKIIEDDKSMDCLIFLENYKKPLYFIKNKKSELENLLNEIKNYIKDFNYRIIKKDVIKDISDIKIFFDEEILEINIFHYENLKMPFKGKHYDRIINNYKNQMDIINKLIYNDLKKSNGWFEIKSYSSYNYKSNKKMIKINDINKMRNINNSNIYPKFNILSLQIISNYEYKKNTFKIFSLIVYKNFDFFCKDNEYSFINYIYSKMDELNNLIIENNLKDKIFLVNSEYYLITKLLEKIKILNPDFIIIEDKNVINYLINLINKYKINYNDLGKKFYININIKNDYFNYINIFNGRIIIEFEKWFKYLNNDKSLLIYYSFNYYDYNYYDIVNYWFNRNYLICNFFINNNFFYMLFILGNEFLITLQLISEFNIINICENIWKNEFSNNNFLIIYEKKFNKISKDKGMSLFNIKKDFYKNIIIEIDINSFFPNIIIINNICYTTIFDKKNEGILPRTIKKLINGREKLINKELSIDEKIFFKNFYKKITNSILGLLNSEYSIFYNKYLRNEMIKNSKIKVNQIINYINKLNLKVIHNKIDSFYIETNLKGINNINIAKKQILSLIQILEKKFNNINFKITKIFLTLILINKMEFIGEKYDLENKNIEIVNNLIKISTPNIIKLIIEDLTKILFNNEYTLKKDFINFIKTSKIKIYENKKPIDFEFKIKLKLNKKYNENIIRIKRLLLLKNNLPENLIYFNYFTYVIGDKKLGKFYIHQLELSKIINIDKDYYFNNILFKLVEKIIKPISKLCDFDLKYLFGLNKTKKDFFDNKLVNIYYKFCEPNYNFIIRCSSYHGIKKINNKLIVCDHCWEIIKEKVIIKQLKDFIKKLIHKFFTNYYYCKNCKKDFFIKIIFDKIPKCINCERFMDKKLDDDYFEYIFLNLKLYLRNLRHIKEINKIIKNLEIHLNLNTFCNIINN